jgi:hypothetical protein
LMGKSTISIAIFNSYVCLPEGISKYQDHVIFLRQISIQRICLIKTGGNCHLPFDGGLKILLWIDRENF